MPIFVTGNVAWTRTRAAKAKGWSSRGQHMSLRITGMLPLYDPRQSPAPRTRLSLIREWPHSVVDFGMIVLLTPNLTSREYAAFHRTASSCPHRLHSDA